MTKTQRLNNFLLVHLPRLIKVELLRLFPDLYDALPLEPDAAWLNPTDNCNMRCIMCNQWRETKTNELTTAEWKGVIDQLAGIGIKKVGFNGGEPLLCKDLPEILAHVRSRGMTSALITSGFLLDDAKLEALLKAGLSHITMSIDGVEAEYEKIRGREWARVEASAERLGKAYREGRIDANIGFVIMKQTLEHLPGVQSLCERVGLPLTFSLVDSTPFFFKIDVNKRTAENTNWCGPEDRPRLRKIQKALTEMKAKDPASVIGTWANIAYIADYFADPLHADIPCTVSQVRVMINSRGELYGGCWSMGGFGSLREKPLKELMASRKFLDAHKAMFRKKCPGCSCGYGTNLRYDLRQTLKDEAWKHVPSLRAKIHEEPTAP